MLRVILHVTLYSIATALGTPLRYRSAADTQYGSHASGSAGCTLYLLSMHMVVLDTAATDEQPIIQTQHSTR